MEDFERLLSANLTLRAPFNQALKTWLRCASEQLRDAPTGIVQSAEAKPAGYLNFVAVPVVGNPGFGRRKIKQRVRGGAAAARSSGYVQQSRLLGYLARPCSVR